MASFSHLVDVGAHRRQLDASNAATDRNEMLSCIFVKPIKIATLVQDGALANVAQHGDFFDYLLNEFDSDTGEFVEGDGSGGIFGKLFAGSYYNGYAEYDFFEAASCVHVHESSCDDLSLCWHHPSWTAAIQFRKLIRVS